MGYLVVLGTLVACGPSTPPTAGSTPASVGTIPRTPLGSPGPAPPPISPRAGPVFSGVTTLGQRDVNSASKDDPEAYHYRLRYSLDQVDTAVTVEPHDHPDFFRTQITTAATVFVTNVTPHHRAMPLS
jgi:hypothetical protein